MNGAERIAAERKRQIEDEGWTPEHDDGHGSGEMAIAAACYAVYGVRDTREPDFFVYVADVYEADAWPWSPEWDKRDKHGRIRRLEIAGALIAAEIDRLLRSVTANT